MAIRQLEDGRIVDEFEIGDEPFVLRDALAMAPEDYAALTPEELQAMKQSRYDNWIVIATAAPVDEPVETPAEPTV